MRFLLFASIIFFGTLSANAQSNAAAGSCNGSNCTSSGSSGSGSAGMGGSMMNGGYIDGRFFPMACVEIRLRCGKNADPAPDAYDWIRCQNLRPTCKNQTKRYQALQRRLAVSKRSDAAMDKLEISVANSMSAWETYKVQLENLVKDFEAAIANPCSNADAFKTRMDTLKDRLTKLHERFAPRLLPIRPESYSTDVQRLQISLQTHFQNTMGEHREEARIDRAEFLRDLAAVEQDAQAVFRFETRLDSLTASEHKPQGSCSSSSSSSSSSTPPNAPGSNVFTVDD